ncbi:MAG TPA: outer membrane lipoprotein-sorting protein [Pyrinomonadaceae bacterium]|nr:outer membrane lipoprotein-sorting protein [Pyrinomonadaceae bacterium]
MASLPGSESFNDQPERYLLADAVRRMVLKSKVLTSNRRISQAFILAVFSLSLLSGSSCKREASAPSADNNAMRQQRGAEIVAEYLKRDASPYRKNRVRMTIAAPSEPVKVYELEIWRKQTLAETLTLTHIAQPADESDLAALSVERPGQPATNITYVSSTDQFRETGTNKMFFGGLTAQELLGEWNKYDYQLLSEKDLNGVKVYEVEGNLNLPGYSVITRSITLFRADNYLPAEMHLFNSEGKELRSFKVTKYGNVAGREVIWLTEIDNLLRQTKIKIETLGLEFPEKVNETTFTRDRLKQIAQRK